MWGAGGGASDPKIPTPASDIASSLINFFVTEDTSRPPQPFRASCPCDLPCDLAPDFESLHALKEATDGNNSSSRFSFLGHELRA